MGSKKSEFGMPLKSGQVFESLQYGNDLYHEKGDFVQPTGKAGRVSQAFLYFPFGGFTRQLGRIEVSFLLVW